MFNEFHGDKRSKSAKKISAWYQPYKGQSQNLIYNLLFCDNPEVLRSSFKGEPSGPWKTLFSQEASDAELEAIASDEKLETRLRIMAFNALKGHPAKNSRDILGLILEVGMEGGLETLAIYQDYRVRYINSSEEMLFWETRDPEIDSKIANLLDLSRAVITELNMINQPRPAPPARDKYHLTVVASDGLQLYQGRMTSTYSKNLYEIFTKSSELLAALAAKNDILKSSAPDEKAILKISVLNNGDLKADNQLISLEELQKLIQKNTEQNGVVWYYRETSRLAPPPIAMQVMQMIVSANRPIRLSSKPDFSDSNK
jgi:hypothetical protein